MALPSNSASARSPGSSARAAAATATAPAASPATIAPAMIARAAMGVVNPKLETLVELSRDVQQPEQVNAFLIIAELAGLLPDQPKVVDVRHPVRCRRHQGAGCQRGDQRRR